MVSPAVTLMLAGPGAELKWQVMLDVVKFEGGTKMFPRFDADQAAKPGLGNSGSQPGYTAPVDVVTLVIRPCADARGARTRTSGRDE